MMRKRRLNILLVWLLLTSMLFTVSTYAWFSANRVLGFQTFNIQVASKGGIEISTDAINWKGVLTFADLINARDNYPASVNQIPQFMTPVSTGGIINNGMLRLYRGEVIQRGAPLGNILVAIETNESEGFGIQSMGEFIAFDLFLKTDATKTLYLTPQSTILSSDNVVSTGIENSFRVAFLNQGTLASNATINQMQLLRGATKAYIWEPNYDVHTTNAVEHARNVYNITTTETNGNLLPYHGIINNVNIDDNVNVANATSNNYPLLFNQVDVDITTRNNNNDFQNIFTINPGVTKIRVYMWIEGQDVDCEDTASAADVSINLQITTDPA